MYYFKQKNTIIQSLYSKLTTNQLVFYKNMIWDQICPLKCDKKVAVHFWDWVLDSTSRISESS